MAVVAACAVVAVNSQSNASNAMRIDQQDPAAEIEVAMDIALDSLASDADGSGIYADVALTMMPNAPRGGDNDGDGYSAGSGAGDDCNDADPLIHPGAAETCANIAVDNDCDGVTSADEASDSVGYYTDADSDSYGASSASPQNSCSAVAGKVSNNTDCNDGRATAYPGAPELCNGLDDN
ncbi:MAG: putative metal-binding motif-containing protein, partial [Planctomycetota bacterium]